MGGGKNLPLCQSSHSLPKTRAFQCDLLSRCLISLKERKIIVREELYDGHSEGLFDVGTPVTGVSTPCHRRQ